MVGGLNARPHTPLLERRVVPPVVSPRRFLQAQEDHPEKSIWTQRVDRILMDAEDQVLLYHGVKIPPSEFTAVRTEAQRLTAQLWDCHPHCSPEKQQEIAATRKAITVVLAQLAEAGHEVELEASPRGSVSSGPSGRSTPLDRYLAAIHNMENPQQAYGGARPRVPVSGLLTQQINLPPPEGASSFQGHPPPDFPPAAEHNHQAGGGNKQHAQPLAPPRGANTDQGQHPMGHQPPNDRNRQTGGRGNSGNRAHNSGDRRSRGSNSGSRDCHYSHDHRRGYDRSHSPPTAALEFERQNVVSPRGRLRGQSTSISYSV